MRALRDQVCMQDRMHLVLEPRVIAADLVAPRRHQPAFAFGAPSGVQICGRYPQLTRLASVPASILSVFT